METERSDSWGREEKREREIGDATSRERRHGIREREKFDQGIDSRDRTSAASMAVSMTASREKERSALAVSCALARVERGVYFLFFLLFSFFSFYVTIVYRAYPLH